MKAIKKPVEIDFLIWKEDINELKSWMDTFDQDFNDNFNYYSKMSENTLHLEVKTLEGSSYSVPKDYIIIRGIKGEFYPCEPNIFNETYEIL